MQPPTQAEQDALERAGFDWLFAVLKGGGKLIVEPITPTNSVATKVGEVSILHGFTVRLAKE